MPRKYAHNGSPLSLDPGEYGRDPRNGVWYCRPPDTPDHCIGNLANHDVMEYEDGTITVHPSILIYYHAEDGSELVWHGWLEGGSWHI